MYPRHLAPALRDALSDTPVVFLAGARQTGKSTLARQIAAERPGTHYVTMDDSAILAAAQDDAQGFIAGLTGPAVVDEVQRVPALLLAIKAAVDRDRQPGRFLLTGSANVLALPKVADTLAGRMEVLTLWPLSQGELEQRREGFVDVLFSEELPASILPPLSKQELSQRIVLGAYPEVMTRSRSRRRAAWFRSYIDLILRREVRDLSNIQALAQLPKVLALVAARSGGLMSFADLARSAQIPQSTIKRYLALLEATYLVHTIPAWSSNLTSRLAKAPKLFLADSGLACHLLGFDAEGLTAQPVIAGGLLEAFVAGEVSRQLGWSRVAAELYHLRSQAGREVDLVLESPGGRCVGIEVKSSATVTGRDLRGLRTLAELAGPGFVRGVVLYTGREVVPFAENLHALPMAALWQLGAGAAPPANVFPT
ncbi:MAG: ATP-binding protein [bacterium]|nr:ATP-binding protein [bacterium]